MADPLKFKYVYFPFSVLRFIPYMIGYIDIQQGKYIGQGMQEKSRVGIQVQGNRVVIENVHLVLITMTFPRKRIYLLFQVVYGDTDSMFVQVPGGTRVEAFEIGQQIADAVTADNPSPVLLKLEKVREIIIVLILIHTQIDMI